SRSPTTALIWARASRIEAILPVCDSQAKTSRFSVGSVARSTRAMGATRPGEPDLEPPAPPSLAEAEQAAAAHVHLSGENFAECFSCGIRPDDGLCIHVGPVAGTDLHAAPWTATEVSPEVVWAAIDCSGAWAVGAPGRGEIVLGRMTGEVLRLPAEGEECIVVAWPLGED